MSVELDGPDPSEHSDEPIHVSEALGELVYDHLEPGRPVEPSMSQFLAEENAEVRREQKLAEADPKPPETTASKDEDKKREQLLAAFERQRLEQLHRLRKER